MSDDAHPESVEFLAAWGSTSEWTHIRPDGKEIVCGTVELPPLMVLSKHAERLVRGSLLVTRLGSHSADWNGQPLYQAIADDPGYLDLHASLGGSRCLEWSISFRISAEPEAVGYSGTYMSPSTALAWMIAVVEEHEREVRAGMIEHTGGLA